MMKLKALRMGAALAAVVLTGAVGLAQREAATSKPANCPADGFSGGFSRGCPQKQFANPADVSAMMAALPDKPYATPQSLRHVLVLGRAVGWVHTSIPLAAKMVEYLGEKTGAWMTTITYDAAAITPQNLEHYDAIFLDSTTGEFLDDPNDKATTDLRRQALLDFVKGGKGLAGVHAATDSYHTNAPTLEGTWPEFNRMIGGFFKFHWSYPTLIPVKVDDPHSPLTVMYPPHGFVMVDETYTFAQDSFSRKRVHVLTSISYAQMSAEDKAKEPAATRRTDGDYALSYIQRVGNGRVFYEAHGHDENVYFLRPFVEHMLAGIQYAIGDLKADDSPSVK
ncbi:MAG TPA: ThuA domain-containing protein [Bryobacteraceae bacterium]|nr:ThuA domain-containing protein [Bryobacteraceae bacterium]